MPQENLEPKHNQTKYKPDNISFKKVKAEKIKSSEVIKVIIPAYNEEAVLDELYRQYGCS